MTMQSTIQDFGHQDFILVPALATEVRDAIKSDIMANELTSPPEKTDESSGLVGRAFRALRVKTRTLKEKETRSALEAELAEAQEALRIAAETAPKVVKRKRKPQAAVRSVAVCSNKAIRDARKAGNQKPNIIEIVSARPTQRTWLVIGRMSSQIDGQRAASYFRCWTENGKIIRFSDDV